MASPARTVGIVGLGFGRAHIPAFQSHGCEVVAVCQRDQAAARKVAERYGVPRVFERWEQMLEAGAARHRRDRRAARAAPADRRRGPRRRGARALREAAGDGRRRARAMVEAAQRAKRTAMTCFNWRFPAAMQRLHAMVEAGFLGRVFHVNLRYFAPRFADEEVAPTWRMDRAQAGHGAMGDLGVHLVDLVRWHFGEFKRLTAQAGIAYPSRTVPGGGRAGDAEDYCAVTGGSSRAPW